MTNAPPKVYFSPQFSLRLCLSSVQYIKYRGKKYTCKTGEYWYDPLADVFIRIPMEGGDDFTIVKWNKNSASLKVENPKEGASNDHASLSRKKFYQQNKDDLLWSIGVMREQGIPEEEIEKVKKRCDLV